MIEQQSKENHMFKRKAERRQLESDKLHDRKVDEIGDFVRSLTGGLSADKWLSHSSRSVETYERLAMAALVKIPKELQELNDLFRLVDKVAPDLDDIRASRKALEKFPVMWRVVGDMAHNATTNLIESMEAPKSLKLSLRQGWKSLQSELGADEATTLEQLLIKQVVMSWIRLATVEYHYTDVMKENSSFQRLKYWGGRLNASQRRFLRASETLARIRKMNLPALQVNIAEKQINLTG